MLKDFRDRPARGSRFLGGRNVDLKRFSPRSTCSIAIAWVVFLVSTPGPAQAVVWSSNGHNYEAVYAPGLTWQQAQDQCFARGGYLATITSTDENDFIENLIVRDASFWSADSTPQAVGPWIGCLQRSTSIEPDSGWSWVSEEPYTYSNWSPGSPDNCCNVDENRVTFVRPTTPGPSYWDDVRGDARYVRGYVFESGGTGVSSSWPSGGNGLLISDYLNNGWSSGQAGNPPLRITSDGAGGAIVLAEGARDPEDYYVLRATRVLASGAVEWDTNVLSVPSPSGLGATFPLGFDIASDGAGGVILATTVQVQRDPLLVSYAIAQRVDQDGGVLWGLSGVTLDSTFSGSANFLARVCRSAESGGALVGWSVGSKYDPYAQVVVARIGPTGNVLWRSDSVVAGGLEGLVSDGLGGVIAVTKQYSTNHPVLAQHLDASGTPIWGQSGIALSPPVPDGTATAAPDGAGGVVVAYSDPGGSSVRVQSLSASGQLAWGTSGITLCAGCGPLVRVVSDGSGGVVTVVTTGVDGCQSHQIRAFHVTADGTLDWTAGGVYVASFDYTAGGSSFDYPELRLARDGHGGAILTWDEFACDFSETRSQAQRLSFRGDLLWGPNGLELSSGAAEPHIANSTVLTGSYGRAAIAWTTELNRGTYVQKVGADCHASVRTPTNPYPLVYTLGNDIVIELKHDLPPDQGVNLSFDVPDCLCGETSPTKLRLVPRSGTGKIFEVSLLTRGTHFLIDNLTGVGYYDLEVTCPGNQVNTVPLNLRYVGYRGYNPSGTIYNSLTGQVIRGAAVSIWRGVESGFELVAGTISTDGTYDFDVAPGVYKILVQYEVAGAEWRGPFTVGGSFDGGRAGLSAELVPVPPGDIAVPPVTADTVAPACVLLGSGRGLARDEGVGLAVVEVVPGTADSAVVAIDEFANGADSAHFRVEAEHTNQDAVVTLRLVDRLGNVRLQEVHSSGTVGVGGPGEGPGFVLEPIRPNPSSGAALVSYSVPRPGRVRLAFYDVQGREVETLVNGIVAAGRHERRWMGVGRAGRRLGAGVLLLRLEFEGQVSTRRIIHMP